MNRIVVNYSPQQGKLASHNFSGLFLDGGPPQALLYQGKSLMVTFDTLPYVRTPKKDSVFLESSAQGANGNW